LMLKGPIFAVGRPPGRRLARGSTALQPVQPTADAQLEPGRSPPVDLIAFRSVDEAVGTPRLSLVVGLGRPGTDLTIAVWRLALGGGTRARSARAYLLRADGRGRGRDRNKAVDILTDQFGADPAPASACVSGGRVCGARNGPRAAGGTRDPPAGNCSASWRRRWVSLIDHHSRDLACSSVNRAGPAGRTGRRTAPGPPAVGHAGGQTSWVSGGSLAVGLGRHLFSVSATAFVGGQGHPGGLPGVAGHPGDPAP